MHFAVFHFGQYGVGDLCQFYMNAKKQKQKQKTFIVILEAG